MPPANARVLLTLMDLLTGSAITQLSQTVLSPAPVSASDPVPALPGLPATITPAATAFDKKPAAPTITIASPAVVSYTAHGFAAGQVVLFNTTGALPTGVGSGVFYYVLAAGLAANTFQMSATLGGSPVVSTGSQSGTHTLYYKV